MWSQAVHRTHVNHAFHNAFTNGKHCKDTWHIHASGGYSIPDLQGRKHLQQPETQKASRVWRGSGHPANEHFVGREIRRRFPP